MSRQPAADQPSALAGRVVLPEHDDWDEARRAWNLAVDQQPAAVVFPESAQDVLAAVRLARERGQRIAAQGTGHGAAALGSLADTILLKTERMRRVVIDPDARTARVEAGVLWREVVEAAAEHGLAALAGSGPDVGVVGYTLGGGVSSLARRYGLAANNVEAVEVVTAAGRQVRADRDTEPELFWALRGGGGNFAIVTALEMRLFPIGEVYAGSLWWPIERGAEVLHAWRELTHSDLPDELTTFARYLRVPPLPEIPESIRGKSFVLVGVIHLGAPAQADALLAPLRALGPADDTIQTMPVHELSRVHMDPEEPAPGVGDGLTLAELPVEAIDELVRVAGAESGSRLVAVEVLRLGGELGRPRPDNGALASIEADYLLTAIGIAPTPEMAAEAATHVESVKSALAPWTARHMNLNFTDTRRDPSTFWTPQAYARLRQIKTKIDPDDIIRSNHPIPPG